MPEDPELRLHEEVLLLALKDEKGTLHQSHYAIALGGALLAELLLEERIAIEERPKGRKKTEHRVVPADPKLLSDPILDECLAQVRDSKKARTAQEWVGRFARLKRVKRRIAISLCRRAILREREQRVLLFFRRTLYPLLDSAPERRLVARLREAVVGDSRDLDPRTALLIGLAHPTGLLKPVLDKKVLKERKDRIKEITEGEVVSEAASAAVKAAQAAAMAAVTAATVAATTAAHS